MRSNKRRHHYGLQQLARNEIILNNSRTAAEKAMTNDNLKEYFDNKKTNGTQNNSMNLKLENQNHNRAVTVTRRRRSGMNIHSKHNHKKKTNNRNEK